MDSALLSKMKELEAENARLKKMYTEVQLQADVLKEVLQKKYRPSRRLEMAIQEVQRGRMSIRLACNTFVISQTCYRYSPKLSS